MAAWHSRRYLPHYEIPGGSCHLTWRLHRDQHPLLPEERTVVMEIIRRDDGSRCTILAGVVMDDHVHALTRVFQGVTSMQLAAAWKSISAHHLCRALGRTAPVWQRDTYQRWIRAKGHLDTCAAYIRANPRRRWPGVVDYPWMLP